MTTYKIIMRGSHPDVTVEASNCTISPNGSAVFLTKNGQLLFAVAHDEWMGVVRQDVVVANKRED